MQIANVMLLGQSVQLAISKLNHPPDGGSFVGESTESLGNKLSKKQ